MDSEWLVESVNECPEDADVYVDQGALAVPFDEAWLEEVFGDRWPRVRNELYEVWLVARIKQDSEFAEQVKWLRGQKIACRDCAGEDRLCHVSVIGRVLNAKVLPELR